MSGPDRQPRTPTVLLRGLRKLCPRCGQGHLFSRWFDLAGACPRCGLPFERGEGYWLGAMAINLGVAEASFGAFLLIAAILTWPDVPWGWLTAGGLAVNVVVPILFYPYSKTIFLAIDLLLHRERWAGQGTASDPPDVTPTPPSARRGGGS
jgi:uncharacterized protein (DUF983 family)